MMEVAEASETSCSPERPPNITATLVFMGESPLNHSSPIATWATLVAWELIRLRSLGTSMWIELLSMLSLAPEWSRGTRARRGSPLILFTAAFWRSTMRSMISPSRYHSVAQEGYRRISGFMGPTNGCLGGTLRGSEQLGGRGPRSEEARGIAAEPE